VTRSVAILIDSLSGGGAERSVLSLARGLESRGARVHLFVLRAERAYDEADAFPVSVVPDAWAARGRTMATRAQALETAVAEVERERGAGFDLFLSNLERTSEVVAATSLAPTFHIVRNSVDQTIRREFRRGPLRYRRAKECFGALNGQHCITISDGVRDEIETSRFVKPASARRIYNAFEVDEIRSRARETVAGLPDEPYVIHVGRCVRQKRHDVLLRAFARVPEPYKLVCLTHRDDKLQRLARRRGVADRLITPGFQQNPYAWIAGARLLVSSSDFEGLCRVVAESLLCGTPVVTTDCPHGPAEIMGDELGHWLVRVGRPDLLGAKITEALATEIDLSGWRFIDEIDPGHIADQFLALIPTTTAS